MRAVVRVGAMVVVAVVVASCAPEERPAAPDAGEPACSEGTLVCDGNIPQLCTRGEIVRGDACPIACADGLGCVVCRPGTGSCNGNESHACADDGSGYVDTTCDPVQGMACDAATGACTGPCAPHQLGSSYIGCEYFPTVTGNTVRNMFDFAVAIANTTSEPAAIAIEGGALTAPVSLTVEPGSVEVQVLPWVEALKLCNSDAIDGCITGTMEHGALAVQGAYHLRSNRPVTVYQFNALQYEKAGQYSFSNDASLLLPTNTWRRDYYAAAWQHIAGINPSQLAVTAWRDGTMVTITARADTVAANGAPAFAAGVPQSVLLNAGDVLEISTRTGDLTGSRIESTQPVQVISGHYCANVPVSISACDHLEESMFSVDALGARYAVNAPAVTTLPDGKVETIRIIATAPNTTLTYDPPQPGAPVAIANAGDFVELAGTAASFVIAANQKVMVAQYMSGRDAGGGTGDPDMALAVPVEQFRDRYLFHAPTSYETSYVDITAPIGTLLLLDGLPPPGDLRPIGASGLGVLRIVPLSSGPGNDGNHTITGDRKFGITVYGYGLHTSYWYAGGLELSDLVIL